MIILSYILLIMQAKCNEQARVLYRGVIRGYTRHNEYRYLFIETQESESSHLCATLYYRISLREFVST